MLRICSRWDRREGRRMFRWLKKERVENWDLNYMDIEVQDSDRFMLCPHCNSSNVDKTCKTFDAGMNRNGQAGIVTIVGKREIYE